MAEPKTSAKLPRSDARMPLTFRQRIEAMRNLPRFIGLVWEASPALTVTNIVLRLVRAGVPVSTLYVGRLIIDEIVRLIKAGEGQSWDHLWFLVAIECAIVITSDIIGRIIALVDSLLGDTFSNLMAVRLMRHAADLDLTHFEDSVFYDKLERARQQTVGRAALLAQVLTQMQELVSMVLLAAGLVTFNGWLLVLLVVALVPAFLGEAHFNAKTYSFMRKWTPERRELDMLRYTGASDETAKEVKMFDLAGFLTARYERLFATFFHTNRSIAVRRALWGGILSIIGTAGYYAAYIVIIVQTVRGAVTLGQLTFLAGSFGRLQNLLEGILARFTSMAESALYLNDLFEFLALQPTITSRPGALAMPHPITRGFVLENVGFRYPNVEGWALRNVTTAFAAGERVALVGENGAGKTTLVKLLARLYDPTEGRILLDGRDLRDYDLRQLRSEIGVIFQDFVHYHMTVSENIAVGRIDELGNLPKIVRAAERSLADAVVDRLPHRYEQMLGKRFKDGVELSYGEWQKIALARAYMRDAQILILDEPTASLDARSEYQVFRRFADLTAGKTAFLISHRFSTVRMADVILVLDRGTVLERGSHEELLRLNGRYAELFNLQAEGYR